MPAPVPPNPVPKGPPPPRMQTRLESADEIRAAIQARQAELLDGGSSAAPVPPPVAALTKTSSMLPPMPDMPPLVGVPDYASPPGSPVAHAAPVAPTAPTPRPVTVRPYRPSQRSPVPFLCAFDDGADEGEVVRIRGERFVIGRAEGDLVLPHDGQISSRHAEIVRQKDEAGRWVWVLTDLGSTNGTFVRVGAAVLRDGQEFLIGRTRYRFDAGAEPQPLTANPSGSRSTVTWNSGAGLPVPSVVEFMADGPAARVLLAKPEYWIGADRDACDIIPADDPFVSPRHARLTIDGKNRWHVNSNKAPNGVWLRVEQTDLTASCYFQLGEQRFSFKVP